MREVHNPGRLIGFGQTPPMVVGQGPDGRLGQVPNVSGIQTALGIGFSQVPVIEYVTWTVDLPLQDADVAGTFGATINILQGAFAVGGVQSVDSSFVQNGTLQVDMLVAGFGLHLFAEPQAGSTIGNAVPANSSAGAYPASPDAYTLNDLSNGALGANTLTNTTYSASILEWGAPAWNAIWHLANAYRFDWVQQQRYLVISELCADVAYFGPYADAEAAGTSQEAVQRFAQRVNAKYRAAPFTSAQVFEPINAQRIGSRGACAGTNIGVFHPTRAYDLMNMTWGGIRTQGGEGCCQPFRKLPRPILIEKGIPIGMILRVQDTYHQQLMQKYLAASDGVPGAGFGTPANIQFDTNSNGQVPSGGTVSTLNELTLDATPVMLAQAIFSNRVLFKGGALKAAILLKGFELWGDWKSAIKQAVGTGTLPIQWPGVTQSASS